MNVNLETMQGNTSIQANDDYDEDEMIGNKPLLEEFKVRSRSAVVSLDDLNYKPNVRFLYEFPKSWEEKLKKFDDFFIGVCQRVNFPMILWVDLSITAFFAIESGIVMPFILFVYGLDGLGTDLAYLMLLVSFVSQLPKRFIWRFRPYMVGRAVQLRRKESAITSSFPSRAVTCSIVYTWYICQAYMWKMGVNIQWWMPLFVICSVILSSFARVNMGVHYPSDCVLGLVQGLLVIAIGSGIWQINLLGCQSCIKDNCYADLTGPASKIVTKESLENFSYFMFIVCFVCCLLVLIISVSKPIDFWSKCDRVYGIILPGIVFQLTFLCKNFARSAIAEPTHQTWLSLCYGVTIAAIASIIGWKINGRLPILSFTLLFVIMFSALAFWRLWILI